MQVLEDLILTNHLFHYLFRKYIKIIYLVCITDSIVGVEKIRVSSFVYSYVTVSD